jgi:hypothetical protein
MRLLFATVLLAAALAWLALMPQWAMAHYRPGLHNTRHAINLAWCGRSNTYCGASWEAWRVGFCETGGTFSVWANNGQYKGIFQVSSHWRSTVAGFAYNPWAQARHAHRIYRLTGGWSHWECARIVGLR